MKVTNSKLISVLLLSLSILTLSGCMTTAMLNAEEAGKFDTISKKKVVQLTDQIIAVGQASQPIANHQHALVLVGNNKSYLIEPTGKDKQLFKTIFQKVDLSALYLQPTATTTKLNPKATHNLVVSMDKEDCAYQGCKSMGLFWQKPIVQVGKNEQQTLKNLGFNCNNIGSKNMICTRQIDVGFTIANKVNNFDKLKYRLEKPVNIKFVKYQYSKGQKRVGGILMGSAFVLDVITFPLQFLYGVVTEKVF